MFALKNWRIDGVVIQMIDAWGAHRIFVSPVWMLVPLLFMLVGMPGSRSDAAEVPVSAPVVEAVRISGTINPAVAAFVTEQLDRVNREKPAAFLLELDTPGGLDLAMRQIVKAVLGSQVPVVVFVAPAGARAASAGALITLAADFAGMAPGTNIGAAHPVSIGGGRDNGDDVLMGKVVEDAAAYARSLAMRRGRNPVWAEKMVRDSVSIAAHEALQRQVVDLVAENRTELLRMLHGRTYRRGDEIRQLVCRDATVKFSGMDWRQKILNTISDPNVAYMLLLLGLLGIFFEISQPGVVLPGAVGAMALLLALFAFQTLPVNYVGMLLIVLALVLFVLEVKVTSFGMLTVGGLISMTFGSLMLFEHTEPFMRLSRAVIAGTAVVTAGFCLLVAWFVVRAQRRRVVSGQEGMAGLRGETLTEVYRDGQIFVRGEYWSAYADEPIPAGETVEVVRMAQGLRLEVRRPKPVHTVVNTHPMSGSDKENIP